MIYPPQKFVIHLVDLYCEYSAFALEVIFVEGFLAWFCFEFSRGGKIYRLYRVPLQKMGNGTIRVMSPELGKDLLPNLGVLAAYQCHNNR